LDCNFSKLQVFERTMKSFLTLIAALAVLSYNASAASYSTEAIMTPLMAKGQYTVDVQVFRLTEQNGQSVEELIAKPKIISWLGCAASLYQGSQTNSPDYQTQENISVDVSWPYPSESGTAFCTVIIKLGDEVVSKSKLQLQITGEGRVPLILSSQNVDPKSVRVEVLKGSAYVLLQFGGKTEEEARKLAIENLGNQTQICDAVGKIVESGLISGTYKENGLALQYDNEAQARRVASTLVAGNAK
jgi:hypothetical protein